MCHPTYVCVLCAAEEAVSTAIRARHIACPYPGNILLAWVEPILALPVAVDPVCPLHIPIGLSVVFCKYVLIAVAAPVPDATVPHLPISPKNSS